MNSKLLLLTLISISFLSACQNTPQRIEAAEPVAITTPDWVNNPPSDSGNFLYGSGVASNKKEAIQEALVDLSSKLGIHVKAKFQSNTKVTDNGYESFETKSESNINTEVEGLSISQYQVEKIYTASIIEVYALLKTDKTLLYTAYKNELDQSIAKHQSAQAAFKNSGRYERYQKSCQEQLGLPVFNRKLSAAKTLNPEMILRPFQAYENKVNQQFRIAKKRLNFNIQAANQSSKVLSEPLSTALAKAELWNKKSQSLSVKASSSVRFNKTSGFYIGRYVLDLKVYDGNQLIGGKQHSIKGASLQSKAATQTQAVKKFAKLIKKEGLWSVLGLQEVECK